MRPTALVAVAAAIVAALPARADPRFAFETVETPHFQIHFHQGEHPLAARLARMAELAHARLSPLLDHQPLERCQVLLLDDTDFANGYATNVLFNQIEINATPPDSRPPLNDFDDYAYEVISHEYTHVLHFDTILGLPDLANSVFGKLWIPNGAQPRWVSEGLAVLEESDLSSAGRIRSSDEEMAVRAQLLEGTFPAIDELSNDPLRWPRGNSWYTIGGRFMRYIADRYGLGAVRDLTHDYGSRTVPLAMNLSSARVLGKSYLELYPEFRAHEAARAQAVAEAVQRAGETPVEPLTRRGEQTRSPRFSRDGAQLYYARAGVDRLPELRSIALAPCCAPGASQGAPLLASDTRLAESFGDDRLAVLPDGRLVYSRPEVFQQFETVEDLWVLDPRSGARERLTRGLRASEPDAAPDGSVVFTWRRPGGRTAIAELAPGASDPRVLFEDEDGEPVGMPRVSPGGGAIAFVRHQGGSWGLSLVGRDGAAPVSLTHGAPLDRDPAWSPDGRYLVFSSDRGGVSDLFALRLADRAVLRITRLTTGAFEPEVSPDGAQLAFLTYSARGYDLARLPFAPERWPEEAPAAPAARPPPTPLPPADLYPTHPYDPLPTLRPHYWLPYAATDARGVTLGALTSGADIAARHEYAATVWWGLDSRQPGWDLAYTAHVVHPDLSIGLSRDVRFAAGLPSVASSDGPAYTDRVTAGSVSALFPFSALARSHALRLTYTLQHLATLTRPDGVESRSERVGAGTLQYSYSDVHRFLNGISAEEGQRLSVALTVGDPALGGSAATSFRQATGVALRYLRLPWSWDGQPLHHALALRLSGGVGSGAIGPRSLFSLGGFGGGDPLRDLINLSTAPTRILRGYFPGSFYGAAYALGTAEYRLPLVDVEAGLWTLPLYLRRLHAAAFVDAGDAFDLGARLRLHAGAGAELRAELVLGYVLSTDLRAGCARGLENSAFARTECYAVLGSGF